MREAGCCLYWKTVGSGLLSNDIRKCSQMKTDWERLLTSKKKKKGIGNTEVQVIDQYEIKIDIGE